ncbi:MULTISPECIES: type III-B CRISPR module RAMP protein Cmr4 [Thermodesulfovibrio]|uniref:CRISPR-associated RAMP protein, Cmr4 family n=1 Tax=Thermodesulfovibrio yellowstonii (strain ATCC 51303 / DSM 11347 / YP87) TaxID=289376 RepID=B5YL02_THEYD|nr:MULTISPECIES: type III-B CRISPR module RAMP protein Cmr4 [Thermodesulfovibrio]ACI21835.1 CRISPR-associated RAMP protein, Cmr4 family [Thermodesulfovibrio yellowstonii DSM 11347]MDI6864140.1 type III-B CRISPR module RAMP protein Cmr4 [Thermodesulfovibrio yellowstonii]
MSEFEFKKYCAIALDPIHIGSGGSRLGRVDLPIVREPGINLPKIPGTSISGPARAYTALQTNKYLWKHGEQEFSCAGRGGDGGEKHCGKINPACPVCIPYGFSKGTGNSIHGLAQFFDAHIVFFPVASMIGPVWITSPMALEGLGLQRNFAVNDNSFYPLGTQIQSDKLNFGWLMLKKDNSGQGNLNNLSPEISSDIIKQRAVLVSDRLFSHVVNRNLEVRTSVSIDPQTGTAEEKALFTYEAIPRGTVLAFDIIYNSGKALRIGGRELKTEGNADVGTAWVKAQVEKGLKLFEILGIGGMGTRGMGRIKILNI